VKKLIVTENQIKKIIDTLLAEDIEEKMSNNFDIVNSFPSGSWDLKNTQEIDAALKSINNEILKYPKKSKFVIDIESSESRVPNKTIKDPATGKPMLPGVLSHYRAMAVENYLKGKVGNNVKITKTEKGAQGPKWKGDDPGLDIYTKWQYVNLSLKISGVKEPEPEPKPCLVNLKISADYYKYTPKSQYENHECDLAKFKVYGNGVYIGILNLNNKGMNPQEFQTGEGAGLQRESEVTITPEIAKNILLKDSEKIELSLYCDVNDETGCHSNPIHMGIVNSVGETILEPQFLTIGKRLKYGEGKVVAILDKCGNKIKTS
jgi:hypothetical protein